MANELGCHTIRVPEANFFRFGSMRVFLTGVGCVGKTSIGAILASRLGCRFYDLDLEIERFFKTSIERLRNRFLTVESFRSEAARALMHILAHPESRNCVIALPPSGLMGRYLRVLKRAGGTIIVLNGQAREHSESDYVLRHRLAPN